MKLDTGWDRAVKTLISVCQLSMLGLHHLKPTCGSEQWLTWRPLLRITAVMCRAMIRHFEGTLYDNLFCPSIYWCFNLFLEVPTSSGKQERTESETTPITVGPCTPDKPHVSASNGLHYSPGFLATSNLSQLAELAANKSAMNQTAPNSVQTPTAQPHLLGNQSRFVIPTQGITPGMFGTYQTSPIVQYHGFTPSPATQVPSPFVKGSIIQLTSGELKRVEDLTTDDFVHSTKLYPDHKLDTSTVVKIEDGTDAGCTHITFTINSSKKQVL